ncbi:MAG: hypothetical protein ISR69_07600 [Gammaproteobacteria bacterium]|nr:hypothetical protein [Gammaproteobacteria bacterium]
MTHQKNLSTQISNSFKSILKITGLTLVIGSTFLTSNVQAQSGMDGLKKVMKEQYQMMTPELQSKVDTLSTDTKMSLMTILSMHNRQSNQATLRQVMLEVLTDYQTMTMGIMISSPEMTADAARRLANHRIPVGGLIPYLGLENINDGRLAVLEGFNDSVEGNANKLAQAAEKGDMGTAASLVGTITSGCVGCHAVFRPGNIGVSDLLK